MKHLRLISLLIAATPLGAAEPLSADLAAGLATIQSPDIAAHIERLAADEFEGRGPGTRGEALTIQYLEQQFRRFGLPPGNPDGTYFQAVPLVGYRAVPRIRIESRGKVLDLRFPEDFVHDVPALRSSASVKNAGVVFAGHGITAPEYGWDDYKGLDVRGKLVILKSGEPEDPVFKGEMRTYFSTRDFKFELAAAKGAAGVLIITDPEKSKTFSVFQTFARMEGAAIPNRRGQNEPLVQGFITAQAAQRVRELVDARAEISVKSQLRKYVSRNVVARIEGSDPALKDEYLVYSAHWDHLGKDTTLTGDQIYNGAIDDAAGTAQMLEIARAFAAMKRKPKRSILFLATTAEEKGYLGSWYYVQHPLYPLARTVANINLDGGNVWGLTSDLISTGYGLSTLDEDLDAAATMQGRQFVKQAIDDGALYFASDQISFARSGVPAAFPFSGSDYVGKPKGYGDEKWNSYSTDGYHKVGDEVKPDWDYTGAVEDARWLMIAGSLIADREKRPEWKSGSEFSRK
jgi:hypothetical protein